MKVLDLRDADLDRRGNQHQRQEQQNSPGKAHAVPA